MRHPVLHRVIVPVIDPQPKNKIFYNSILTSTGCIENIFPLYFFIHVSLHRFLLLFSFKNIDWRPIKELCYCSPLMVIKSKIEASWSMYWKKKSISNHILLLLRDPSKLIQFIGIGHNRKFMKKKSVLSV